MHFWVQGIQVYSIERPHPFPKGDNFEIAKIHCVNLKFFFSRTTRPISSKLGTIHPHYLRVKEFFKKFVQIKDNTDYELFFNQCDGIISLNDRIYMDLFPR